ncbi:hypothetical protein J437_LFUL009297 [Ladona fulva]|uniref:Uncharacterized protein n=1 Tax=Ladona fulva TaxID=123851 RepID=A0A8K0P0K2_LADFU|nr:hypothetical protein J437_LFUL009297 [Ladona fulva]
MFNDFQCIMDVDSPISSSSANLKRCSSAPMINELNTTMSAASSTTNSASRDSFAFNVFSREQPRTRRFSASFSPLLQSPLITSEIGGGRSSSIGSDSPPDPSSPSPPPSPTPPPPRGLAPRVSQLRQEGRLLVDVAGVRVREAAHERELNSAMQISRSWEDLTLLTPSSSAPSSNSASPPNTNPAFSPGGNSLHLPASTPPPPHMPLSPSNVSSPLALHPRVEGNGKVRGILDPLHVHLPSSSAAPPCSLFSSSSPFSHLSLSSFSPTSSHPPHPHTCSSPLASPSTSTSFPSPTRPGFSVKRKFELGELSEEKSPVNATGGIWDHHVYPPAKRANLGLLVTNNNPRLPTSAGGSDSLDGRDDSSTGFAFRPVNLQSGEGSSRSCDNDGASNEEGSDTKNMPMEMGGNSDSANPDTLLPQLNQEGGAMDLTELQKDLTSKEEEMATEGVKNSSEEATEDADKDSNLVDSR